MKKLFIFLTLTYSLLTINSVAQEQIDYKADKIKFEKYYKGGAKRLIGNVRFTTKDGMIMTCDSSYFLDNNNIEAFSHIFIRQGDSLTITGNTAHYDGTTKQGIIDGKVTCTEKDMVLTTDVLNFDSRNKTASYYTGGTIVSKDNKLTSKHGFYDSPSKTISFKYDVKLVNPDYTMLADTLKYITTSKTVVFLGPTNVISKQDQLYCERGWYNTQTQLSHLTKNAIIYSGKSIMKADSIHYDKKKETGYGFSNVNLIDTAEKTIISGNRSYSNKKAGIMWMTDHALLTKIMDKDSLFATADSMWAFEKKIKIKRDTSIETRDMRQDTTNKLTQDSILKSSTDTALSLNSHASNLISHKDTSKFKELDSTVIKAYRHVKIYKKDMQGIADTMIFSTYDSTATLYHLPVLWHKQNQLSGNKVIMYYANKKIDRIQIPENTFIVEQIDTIHYNQIKGKLLWAYFKDDTLRKIDITGNAQATYYLKKEKKGLQGVNIIESSKLTVNEKAGTLNQITFYKKPKAKVYPMKDLDVKAVELKGFSWQIYRKPKSKEDLFKKDRREGE
jgi:lipopolysaccharide export system protein LptA